MLAPSRRIPSIDLLRGVVMILMALDHVRYFFSEVKFSPEDLSRTTLPLFLTRWVTHFCAPAFFFLAGTAAYLGASRAPSRKAFARFLATRGLFLVALELSIIGFAWTSNPGYSIAGVIWSLGWSMVVLALLLRLPTAIITLFGLVIVFGHDLFDGAGHGSIATLLHGIGVVALPGGSNYFVLYALFPWCGVMAVGYATGALYRMEAQIRRRSLLAIGVAAVILFVALRTTNAYGNPETPSTRGAAGHFAPQATTALRSQRSSTSRNIPPRCSSS